MRVLNVYVKNIQSVKEIDLNLSGHCCFVLGGRNAQGKTSALKALYMALLGKSGMGDEWPECPVREGENESVVRVTLSGDNELHDQQGFVAELVFQRQRNGSIKETFRLVDSTGEEAPEPRTLLKSLFSKLLDPTRFDRMNRKEKKEALQSLVPELDFTEKDAEIERLFAERTDVNRDGKKLKAIIDQMKQYPDAPASSVSVGSLLTELTRRQAVNKANEEKRRQLNTHNANVNNQAVVVGNIVNKIADLERQLEEQRFKLQQQKEILDGMQTLLVTETAAVRLLQDEETATISEQIQNAESVNAKVKANADKKAKTKELDELRAKSQELTDRMEAIKEEKQTAIKNAKFPVEGLGFDDEGVTFEGLPYEQASKSKRMLIGAKIAMACSPKLQTLICEFASDLDFESLEELERLCKENGFNCIVEVATRSKEDDKRAAVVFVDGEAFVPETN